jgi:hypothetical protein
MPLQNRVTPFGEIVAIPQRGLLTGNRGILHDPVTRTLGRRRWTTKAWIACTLDYKGARRVIMAGRSWTELFFLDEATALAAGHRPCFLCRREAAGRYRGAWAGPRPSARAIDETLHRERLDGRRRRLHALPADFGGLPDGTMVAAGGDSFLLLGGRILRWTEAGYAEHAGPLEGALLLTPPATVAVLAAGYRPILHPSALRASPQFESKGRSAGRRDGP